MNLTKSEPTVLHNTFVLERHYSATVDRVFAALSDPAKKRRWFGGGHNVETFEMDFRVGGSERSMSRMGDHTPFPGAALTAEGVYLDIVAGKRIVLGCNMAMNGRVFSAALATFELIASGDGTDLVFTHQAAFFEGADGPEMRKNGWQKLLSSLEAELAQG